MKKRTLEKVEIAHRAAVFQPQTADKEARTVELTWSTGAAVVRRPWFSEPYTEVLSMEESAIRMGRLNSGAPLLKDHKLGVDFVHGVVEKAWVQDGEGRALVRFAKDAESEVLFEKVLDGILRNISVAYFIHEISEQPETDSDKYRVFTAIDWEPYEVSLVAVGADDGAKIRNAERSIDCVVHQLTKEERKLMDPVVQQNAAPAAPAAPQVNEAEIRQAAAAQERARIEGIQSTCETLGLDGDFARSLISEGVSLDVANQRALAKKREAAPAISGVTIVRDERDTFARSAESALLARFDSVKYQPKEGAREFVGLNLRELARESLKRQGIRTEGMSVMEIAERAMHSSSDFPKVLANVANKTLRDAYAEAPQTYAPLVREVEVSDFKEISRTQLGDAPELLKVGQNGEVENGSTSENAEKYAVESFARIIAITRKTIINDDLGAFTRIPQSFGMRAKSKIADLVYDIFNSNPKMSDGKALFHADHGNIAVMATAIAAGLPKMRELMKKQQTTDGMKLNLRGAYLLVGADREDEAEKLCSSLVVPGKDSDVNTFARTLQVISDARLNNSAYYLAAQLGMIDLIEIAFLEGAKGVRLETKMGFEVEGMQLKAALDVGVKGIDWRGFVKNAGA